MLGADGFPLEWPRDIVARIQAGDEVTWIENGSDGKPFVRHTVGCYGARQQHAILRAIPRSAIDQDLYGDGF